MQSQIAVPSTQAICIQKALVSCIVSATELFLTLLGPRYKVAMSVNSVMCFMAICAAFVLRVILVRLNKKLEQGIFVEGAINSGITEGEKRGFRYRV